MAKPKSLPAGELNWRQTRFVERYVSNGNNATEAYLYAGFSPKGAKQGASRLLTNVDVMEAVEAERERLQAALNFKREDALRILVGMATASIDDFAPLFSDPYDRENYKDIGHKRFALKSFKNTDHGVEITLSDRLAALNELWEKLGLGENAGTGNWFDGMDRLVDLIRQKEKKSGSAS